MERAARKFASWVLALHLLGLAALVLIVVYASVEVYSKTRGQALNQVRIRQELLAAQAARGIEQFYRSVLQDLELARRAPKGTVAADAMRSLVWEQLRGRASHLVEIDTATLKPVAAFADDAVLPTGDVLDRVGPWLKGIQEPAISDALHVGGKSFILVATPTIEKHILVAAVPIRSIETRFLNDLNEPANMAVTLVDERMRVLSSDRRGLVGTDMTSPAADPRIRAVAAEYARQGRPGTREFLEPMTLSGVTLEPMMATLQPVDMPGAKKWWLAVSSNLAEVDQAVGQFFRRAAILGGLVVFGGTAVLVSTSTQLIRGRLRLARVQREMMSRELSQAREIQLMWLPEGQEHEVCVDVAAVNRPASHVSGDFYNWFDLPPRANDGPGAGGRACVVIGDVTGHGLPAAFLMATTQLLVRTVIERVGDPGACMREVNSQLCQHVFSGQFVTLLILVIDPARGVVEAATAGHPPPLVGSDGAYEFLKVEPQLVLAVDDDVPYKTQRFALPLDTNLLLYTDGVTDVENPADQRLHDEGLQASLFGRFKDARTIVDSVLDAVDTFRASVEPADDLTLVAVRFVKSPAANPDPPPDPSPDSGVTLAAGST